MSILMERFTRLYFMLIDRKELMIGNGEVDSPPLKSSQRDMLDRRIEEGGGQIWKAYQTAYIQPLGESIKSETFWERDKFFQTVVVNAAIQPASKDDLRQDVKRVQAVVEDMYKSFLYSRRRLEIGLPLMQKLSPLVALTAPNKDVPTTPYSVVLEEMKSLSSRFRVGAVSLPAGYRKHPLLWGVLAHEVGGHSVLDADKKLLPELKDTVHRLFRNDATLQRLWDHWCEEAASEVCAVLNLGPLYGLLSMLWIVVMTSPLRERPREIPKLSCKGMPNQSGDDTDSLNFFRILAGEANTLDHHPVHALIPYVIIGAVTKLNALSQETKARYLVQLKEIARNLVGSPRHIEFPSSILVLPPFPPTIPFKKMQASAMKVGAYIATVKLKALNNGNLQDLETWNNADEEVAQLVSRQLLSDRSIADIVANDTPDIFEDARLLAGALFAVLRDPDQYDAISEALGESLGVSYDHDRAPDLDSDNSANNQSFQRRQYERR